MILKPKIKLNYNSEIIYGHLPIKKKHFLVLANN